MVIFAKVGTMPILFKSTTNLATEVKFLLLSSEPSKTRPGEEYSYSKLYAFAWA